MNRLAVVAVVAAACGKPGDRGAGSAAPAWPAVVVDAAAVNALVPAALHDTLVFETRELVIERGKRKTIYTLAAPRGWGQAGTLFATLRPEDHAGSVTRFEIGSNCDGPCTPKPWEAIADRVNFAPRATRTIIKDERAAGRRTMIAEIDRAGEAMTEVVVAWWADGANYHTCTASLDQRLGPAALAFAKACQAVAIDGDD